MSSISVTFPDQSTPDQLRIVKKIGEGKFSVYHAYSSSQKTSFALKVFPKDSFGASQYKKEQIMSNLSHPNIIKHIPARIPANAHYYAILTEFAKYGDFFELIVNNVFDSEIILRTYFHQLISGLEHIHGQGLAHLDLKLENLMLGSDFTLKIIDFDQAQKTEDKILTSGGTKGFRAPEVMTSTCRNFNAADVYSAGVVLYAFKSQEYPFSESMTEKDGKKSFTLKNYSTFMKENSKFWAKKAAEKKDSSIFSDDFKELINGMLEFNVEKRFTIEDVKKSRWFNGPVLDAEKLKSEVKARWEAYENKKMNERSY